MDKDNQVNRSCSEALLTIILPVHNEAQWINETIDSIQCQTLKNIKLLIGDNASSDGSQEIIVRAVQKCSNAVYVLRSRNIGAVANVADLVKRCSTPYLAFIGAHDLIDRDWAMTLTGLLQANPSLSLAYSRTTWIDSQGRKYNETDGGDFVRIEESPLERYASCISHKWGECTAVNGVFRSTVFNGFWFPKVNGPDHILLSRASYHGMIARVDKPLYLRREFARESTYAQRIAGNSFIKIAPNYNATIAAYIADYLLLNGLKSFNPPRLITILRALACGYGRRSFRPRFAVLAWCIYFVVVASAPVNRAKLLKV